MWLWNRAVVVEPRRTHRVARGDVYPEPRRMICASARHRHSIPSIQRQQSSNMASQVENKFMHADSESFPYTFLRDVDIPLHTYEKGLIRANVFLPKGSGPFPVIATYGPCKSRL